MKRRMFQRKHTIMYWFWMVFLVFFVVFLCAGLLFGFAMRRIMLNQTMQETETLFSLYAEDTDESLEVINRYMYQTLLDSSAVKQLEREGTKTEQAFAQKEISDAIAGITAWDENVDTIMLYSPEGSVREMIEVGDDADYQERQILKNEVRDFIDGQLAEQASFQTENITVPIGDTAYLVRIYKINDSYACAGIKANHLLESVRSHLEDPGAVVFIADLNGQVLKSTGADLSEIDISGNGTRVSIDRTDYVQIQYQVRDGGYTLGSLFPVRGLFRRIRLLQGIFWVMLAVLLLLLPVYMLVIRRLIVDPIRALERDMRRVGDGDWELVASNPVRVKEFDSLAATFTEMIGRIRELKIENYEKELAVRKSELQYLQMQNQPHFYLNALNIIYSLAQVKDFRMIQKMTLALVSFLRYSFQDMSTLVMLRDELEHVKDYIEIQQMRFSYILNYEEDVPEELLTLMVPPFVIQSFIENSVKYALRNKKENLLKITARRETTDDGECLMLEIRDNGEGYDPEFLESLDRPAPADEDKRYHVGLRNVRERLSIIYGHKATMVLSNEDGAVTTIRIPIIGEDL